MKSRFHFPSKFGLVITLIVAVLVISNSLAQRHTPTIPPEVLSKDFDLVPSGPPDGNGFLVNPKWGKQVVFNTPPSPKESSPLNVTPYITSNWTSSPQWPNCA